MERRAARDDGSLESAWHAAHRLGLERDPLRRPRDRGGLGQRLLRSVGRAHRRRDLPAVYQRPLHRFYEALLGRPSSRRRCGPSTPTSTTLTTPARPGPAHRGCPPAVELVRDGARRSRCSPCGGTTACAGGALLRLDDYMLAVDGHRASRGEQGAPLAGTSPVGSPLPGGGAPGALTVIGDVTDDADAAGP